MSNLYDTPFGEIEGIQYTSVGEHVNFLTGPAFDSSQFDEDGGTYRLVRGINITKGKTRWAKSNTMYWDRMTPDLEKYQLKEDDILIGMDGSLVGRNFALITQEDLPSLLVQRVARLRTEGEVNTRFLYQLFASDVWLSYVDIVKTNSGIPHISNGDIKEFKFHNFSIKQQQKIASILSTVDNLIDQTQKLIDKYTAVKQGMMADLFSRGIDLSGTPETNKSYGQLRPSYKDAPELYQETEIGWVPLDWTFNQLGSYIEKYLYGPRFDASMYSEYGNVKTIRGTDFSKQGDIKYEQVPLAEIPFPKIRHHILKDGDLVVVTTADCGLTAVYEEQSSDYIPSAYAVKIKLTDDANPYFIKAYMQTFLAETQVNKYVRQGTLGNLPGSDILRFHIALPSLKEQKAMVERLNSIDKLIEKEKQYVEKLKLKKKGLMQDLLTGKVKV